MGILSSKYPNAEAVETALDKGASASEEVTSVNKTLSEIGQDMTDVKEDLNKFKQLTEEEVPQSPIVPDIFNFGLVNASGQVTDVGYHAALQNIFSHIISVKGTTIKPKQTDTIFKVVYYDENGAFISATSWMGLSAFTIVDDYTIVGDYCRICIANSSESVTTNTVEGHLAKYVFDSHQTSTLKINGNKVVYHNGEIAEECLIPFANFPFTKKIYKQNGKYFITPNLNDLYVKKSNGVVGFISPNGTHDADGLTVATPVKTLNEALAIPNVETIIMLSGTYTSNTNFFVGNEINTPVNIIGLGEVVIDNAANSNNAPINIKASCYVKNIHFKHGNNTVKATLTSEQYIVFENCEFSDSDNALFSNGMAILGGKAYVVDCKAYNNSYDGFNYHSNGNNLNYSMELNCKSYGNGTTDLSGSNGQSSNATTSHDGSYIVRINGDYYACHGGVVADLDCYSANYGCKTGISTVTDSVNYADRMSNYWCSGGIMYLYDCESYSSKYDTAKVNNGAIISNVTYNSNYQN